jgi:hypothetical protein
MRKAVDISDFARPFLSPNEAGLVEPYRQDIEEESALIVCPFYDSRIYYVQNR